MPPTADIRNTDPTARLRHLVEMTNARATDAPIRIIGSEPRLAGGFRLNERV